MLLLQKIFHGSVVFCCSAVVCGSAVFWGSAMLCGSAVFHGSAVESSLQQVLGRVSQAGSLN
jgi:hypothetical protein